MTPNADDAERTADARGGEYAALHVDDAAVVIYARDNHRAWVQSDLAVALEAMA